MRQVACARPWALLASRDRPPQGLGAPVHASTLGGQNRGLTLSGACAGARPAGRRESGIDSSVTSSHCHRSAQRLPQRPRPLCASGRVLNARSGSREWGLATAELGAGWPWMLMPQEQVAPGNGPSFHVDLPGGGRPPAGSSSHSAAGPWRLRGGVRGFRASSGVAFRMSRIRQRSPLSDSETFPPPQREAPSPPPLQAPARPLPVSVDAPVWAFHIDGLTPCSPCLACLSLGPATLR